MQELNSRSDTAQNAPSDDDGVLDEVCNDFGSITGSELEEEVYEEPSSPRPHDVQPSDIELAPPAFGLPHVVEAVDSTQMAAISTNEEIKPPRGKSIAHFNLTNNKVVFLSLDLETGGEYCGIIQLSGQLFRQDPEDHQKKSFIIVDDTFNEYVAPPDGAFWNEEACRQSHGLSARSPEIQNGRPFITVWTNFCSWIQRHVGTSEKCILCAYRGETCDMRWIWKHCLAPRSQLNIPKQIVYFMDPLEVIKAYKCPLHPVKSKLDSLELGVVYQYITGHNLNSAHDALLVDVKAQTTVITSKHYREYIDKSKSIRLVEDIFTAAEQRDMLKKMESLRPVHEPWFELVEGDMDGPKPNWMRQAAPLPCESDKCFFCLNSLTTGVDHKRKRHTVTAFVQHDCSRTKTIDCTDKQVDLQIGSSYCKQCYRERPGTRAEKLNGINTSRMAGCHVKNVFVNLAGTRDMTCTRRSILDCVVVH